MLSEVEVLRHDSQQVLAVVDLHLGDLPRTVVQLEPRCFLLKSFTKLRVVFDLLAVLCKGLRCLFGVLVSAEQVDVLVKELGSELHQFVALAEAAAFNQLR